MEVADLTFRGPGWHVCARCHRNKKNLNLHATLRSGSELVSSSQIHLAGYWQVILPLIALACRPRARAIRACAVGIARRGAQIRRPLVGARTLQSRWALVLSPPTCQMDADVRVTVRHSSGLSAVPSAAQRPCVSKPDGPPAVREPARTGRMQTRRDSFGRAWVRLSDSCEH